MSNKKLKFGFDFHGVLDTGEVWKLISELLINNGHEVHLITGSMWGDKFRKELKNAGIVEGINFTKFFSVSDFLIEEGCNATFDVNGNPYFPNRLWNRVKGDYCKRENIDMHFDDSTEYHKYFSTPNAIIKSK